MAKINTIKELACEVLTIHRPMNEPDNSLWGKAQRLVRNVEFICQLPELNKADIAIDRFCLTAAAYLNDCGLAGYLESKKSSAEWGTWGSNDEYQMDWCEKVIVKTLGGSIEKSKIEKTINLLAESYNHPSQMTEAMILSDARNLDDMGLVGIFNEFRRLIYSGKNLSDALKSWKRRIDYRYWEARLKESFRFESVRKIAEQRLVAAEDLMARLEVEHLGSDLGELSFNPALA